MQGTCFHVILISFRLKEELKNTLTKQTKILTRLSYLERSEKQKELERKEREINLVNQAVEKFESERKKAEKEKEEAYLEEKRKNGDEGVFGLARHFFRFLRR